MKRCLPQCVHFRQDKRLSWNALKPNWKKKSDIKINEQPNQWLLIFVFIFISDPWGLIVRNCQNIWQSPYLRQVFCGRNLRPQKCNCFIFRSFCSRNLRPQSIPFFFSELEHEVIRKAFYISFHLLVKTLILNTVKHCQIEIHHHLRQLNPFTPESF